MGGYQSQQMYGGLLSPEEEDPYSAWLATQPAPIYGADASPADLSQHAPGAWGPPVVMGDAAAQQSAQQMTPYEPAPPPPAEPSGIGQWFSDRGTDLNRLQAIQKLKALGIDVERMSYQQGRVLAMKAGMSKEEYDELVGHDPWPGWTLGDTLNVRSIPATPAPDWAGPATEAANRWRVAPPPPLMGDARANRFQSATSYYNRPPPPGWHRFEDGSMAPDDPSLAGPRITGGLDDSFRR